MISKINENFIFVQNLLRVDIIWIDQIKSSRKRRYGSFPFWTRSGFFRCSVTHKIIQYKSFWNRSKTSMQCWYDKALTEHYQTQNQGFTNGRHLRNRPLWQSRTLGQSLAEVCGTRWSCCRISYDRMLSVSTLDFECQRYTDQYYWFSNTTSLPTLFCLNQKQLQHIANTKKRHLKKIIYWCPCGAV